MKWPQGVDALYLFAGQTPGYNAPDSLCNKKRTSRRISSFTWNIVHSSYKPIYYITSIDPFSDAFCNSNVICSTGRTGVFYLCKNRLYQPYHRSDRSPVWWRGTGVENAMLVPALLAVLGWFR